MTKRAAVFGAGGFIGAHLCAALLDQGYAVRGLTRSPPLVAHAGVDWRQGDFADTVAVGAVSAGCEVIFHLVGSTTPAVSNADPIADIRDNLIPTLGFLAAVQAAGTARVVFASSGGTVYGIPDAATVDEHAATRPLSAYGVSKLAAERYFELYRHLHGLDYCVLRIANVFGEHQRMRRQQGVVAAFMAAAAAGRPLEIWGDGQVVRDYIYAGDVAGAMIRAAEAPLDAERVFNIGSGRGRTVAEVAQTVIALSGQPLEIVYRPGRPVDVPAIVLGIERARRGLNWVPATGWDTAMARTYRWYEQQHNDGAGAD